MHAMSKALFNLPVLMAAVFSLAATAVITALVFAGKPEPPTLLLDVSTPVPSFNVTDHTGQTLTDKDLSGTVWVCDFFLTRCNGICPTLSLTMADLAGQLAKEEVFDDVKLVSFSVDPDHDTVEQLDLYRRRNIGAWDRGSDEHRAELNRRWVHARAEDRDAFWKIIEEGFQLYVGEAVNDPSTPVAHSGKLVLIDEIGHIRGYYDGLTDMEKPALLADIRRLVEQAK